ncbi:MFS transporter [Paenibacillus sp. 1011MAR3C5]|uniref:MFS transporter n=1 Tax=Paenibacillus sp. 1011MAR3C5 TaxID=1675787 RepID=UPI000E6CC7D3|nr:MFS transporter [Paenibacillus sp. 1011MAR3C5]RJE90340.1 MFS transporter [Paenibacillus sp. 1011MAR3C5]
MHIQARTKEHQESKTGKLQEWTAPGKQQQLYKRTLAIVILSQLFGGAGLAAGVTVGALLAQDMLGTERYAGIPAALITLGSALASFLMGRLTQRFGRRSGLAAGFLAGGIGAIGIITAAVAGSIPLLYFALFIYGAGTATNLQARYAGTDLAKPKQRATAISIAMVSTTFGAVAGPNLIGVMGNYAESIGVPRLAGPFILAAGAFTIAGLIILVLLRPDPFLVASRIAEAQAAANPSQNGKTQAGNRQGIKLGAAIMILTQIIMVAIMTMTPIHMTHHGHGLNEVGIVIGIHVGAMYLPSLFTGMLIDRIGRIKMACASGVVLLASGLLAAFGPADSMLSLITALALLGLGWNLGLISGTALIVDSTSQATRAKTQGTVDVLIALAGASGGVLSGMIVAQSSYATLALAGGLLSLLLIPVMFWSSRSSK